MQLESAETLLFQQARNEMKVELKFLQRRISMLEKAFGVGKICPNCGQPEGIVEFGRNYARSDGKQVYCKKCRKKPVQRLGGDVGVSAGDKVTCEGETSQAEFGSA